MITIRTARTADLRQHVEALEESGELLRRVSDVFFNINDAETTTRCRPCEAGRSQALGSDDEHLPRPEALRRA